MYNPYQNRPMYMPPYGDPYGQQMMQMQQYQQQMQSPMNTQMQAPQEKPITLSGRIINDPAEIMPSEIPMDGTPSVFVTKDYTKIFVKVWSADGTIKTVAFVPMETSPAPVNQNLSSDSDMTKVIMERFDKLEKMINRNNYRPKNHQNQNHERNEENG